MRQKPLPRAMPREWRDDQHLAHVARPHHEKQRVVLHEILCGRIERRQAKAREQEDGKRPPRLEILHRPDDALNRRAEAKIHGRGFANAVVRDLERAEARVVIHDLVVGFRQHRPVGPRRLGPVHRCIGTLFGALRETCRFITIEVRHAEWAFPPRCIGVAPGQCRSAFAGVACDGACRSRRADGRSSLPRRADVAHRAPLKPTTVAEFRGESRSGRTACNAVRSSERSARRCCQ